MAHNLNEDQLGSRLSRAELDELLGIMLRSSDLIEKTEVFEVILKSMNGISARIKKERLGGQLERHQNRVLIGIERPLTM
jgi:hypothetical protein